MRGNHEGEKVVGYKGNLRDLFPRWLEEVPQSLMNKVTAAAGNVALELAQNECPVGEPPDDKHPGWMRDNIKLRFEKYRNMAKAIISISDADVPYATIVTYGNKTRPGNNFMELARDGAIKYIKMDFKHLCGERMRQLRAELK